MDFCTALDALKLRYGLDTDYKLALFLDISRGRLANYRISNKKPADELIIQVESLLELPPGTLLLDIHSQFAKSASVASVYRALKIRLIDSKLPQALIFIEVLILSIDLGGVPASLLHCILCKIRIAHLPGGLTVRYLSEIGLISLILINPPENHTHQHTLK